MDGTGVLNATGSAGIGNNYLGGKAGTIIINGGIINASATSSGAAIGGNDLVLIEINGGTINADATLSSGAGIGGAQNASVTGIIRINGGTVYAEGGGCAAGIGGGGQDIHSGYPATTAPNIYISDNANVTAIAGKVYVDTDIPGDNIGNGGMSRMSEDEDGGGKD